MQIIKDITLDLNKGVLQGFIEIHQGEKGGRFLRAKIVCDGNPFEIPDTFSAYADACLIEKYTENRIAVARDIFCEINPNEGETSTVIIPITEKMSANSGKVEIALKFVEDGSTVTAQLVRLVVLGKTVSEPIIPEYHEEAVLLDKATGEHYGLYVFNGKLTLEQRDIQASEPKYGISLSDKTTGKTYTLYCENGKLKLDESEV